MDTVFSLFALSPYTFLEISRGSVEGDMIDEETEAEGIFKLRNGMNVSADQETKNSDATLHIKPTEPFVSTGLVGHGIRVSGREYEIVGLTAGTNFDNNQVEHYRVTLQERKFSNDLNS